jgi:hypothetical protein
VPGTGEPAVTPVAALPYVDNIAFHSRAVLTCGTYQRFFKRVWLGRTARDGLWRSLANNAGGRSHMGPCCKIESHLSRKRTHCSPQVFRIAPNQELGALALNMLSKLVTSRNLSLSQSRNPSLSHWKSLNQGRTYFLRTTGPTSLVGHSVLCASWPNAAKTDSQRGTKSGVWMKGWNPTRR